MLIEGDNIPIALRVAKELPRYKNILVCDPNNFRVEYALNPHMQDQDGSLKKVNKTKAIKQWNQLIDVFRSLRLNIWTIKSQASLPDMVFSANQSLQIDEKEIILSKMASMQREEEVKYFSDFYKSKGFKVYDLGLDQFEGMGDAIWHPGKRFIWGGYGYRSSLYSYRMISQKFSLPISPLKLINPHFYHLDTCFFVINENCAAYVPKAFDGQSIENLKNGFEDLIEIDHDEAMQNFAGNAFCPDGLHVILQKGSIDLCKKLVDRKFTPIEVETSEFIKGGGSCFCLKMALY